jgi:hypothetical protein
MNAQTVGPWHAPPASGNGVGSAISVLSIDIANIRFEVLVHPLPSGAHLRFEDD